MAETARDSGHNLDLISALAPLLGVVSAAHDGESFQAALLARELRERFGLRVNPYAVEQWIPQLKAAGIVKSTTLTAPKGQRSVQQLTFSRPAEATDKVDERNVEAVVNRFLDFARPRLAKVGQDIPDSELEACFFREIADLDFLAAVFRTNKPVRGPRTLTLNSSTTPQFGTTDDLATAADLDVLCAAFFLHMAEEEVSTFNLIVQIASGAVISEVLFDVGNPQTNTSFDRQRIVLDGPICIKALGLNSKEDEEHTVELLESLTFRGATLAVFEHTIDEIKSLLEAALRGSQEPWGYGPTVRRIRSDRHAEVVARAVLADVESALRALNVNLVLSNPTTSAAWALLPQSQEEQIGARLAWYENPASRDRDAASLAATYRLRGGLRSSPKQVHEARYIFLTENSRLVDVAYSFFSRDPDAPIAVTDRYLAGYLFVMCGGSDDITGLLKKRVLANCANAVAPRTELVQRMAQFLSGLDESRRKKYAAMMTDGRAARYLTEITFGNVGYLQADNFEDVLEDIYDEAFVERSRALAEQRAALEQERAAMLAAASADHDIHIASVREEREKAVQEVERQIEALARVQEDRQQAQTALLLAQGQLNNAIKKAGRDAREYGKLVAWGLYATYVLAAVALAWLGDFISQSSGYRPLYYLGSGLLVLLALHQMPQLLIEGPKLGFVRRRYKQLVVQRGLSDSAHKFRFDPATGQVELSSSDPERAKA
ncbi:hypothetical protein [Pseudacidovorax sp. RU35E]|uniref:hypothetical protein n=1 Tax=Pseudacidovorax sp. RU35E TaxID=1907403 RepID=UPI001179C8B7|nr:hypothetical protein [Pseudacidovorax sp. RU35E]